MKGYYDIAGDGGSDVLAQVQAQDESVARSLADVRNLVAIGSGKGGVGKSTVTMQMAFALRELGNEVSILDADLNGPCQARLGGLRDHIFVPGKSGASIPRTRLGVLSSASIERATTPLATSEGMPTRTNRASGPSSSAYWTIRSTPGGRSTSR